MNKLLAGTGDPASMIYPVGYGSGENSPSITGMGILTIPNFYDDDGSGMALTNVDLPIGILSSVRSPACVATGEWAVGGPVRAVLPCGSACCLRFRPVPFRGLFRKALR